MGTTQLTALALGLGGLFAGAVFLAAFWFMCKYYDKWVVKKDPAEWERRE